LIILGKQGWNVNALAARLRQHPEAGFRLRWIENGSDSMLCSLYANCAGLLMASEGEGYGLPIIEAARYGMPVLARSLPIFREIAGNSATFFFGSEAAELEAAIAKWIQSIDDGKVVRPDTMKLFSWEDSARGLLHCIGIESKSSLVRNPD
jgi:glycosyltransferase involved in cell wall biosynthesis